VLVKRRDIDGLAVIIAWGVVYKAARIALQERAWERAGLRVLEFMHAEVSRLRLSTIGQRTSRILGYSST
jgi:hypothetical protein